MRECDVKMRKILQSSKSSHFRPFFLLLRFYHRRRSFHATRNGKPWVASHGASYGGACILLRQGAKCVRLFGGAPHAVLREWRRP